MKNFIFFFIVILAGLEANALTTSWNGNSWNNGEPNWSNGNDAITIEGNLDISFTTVSVKSLTIKNGARLVIHGGFEIKKGGDNLTLSNSAILSVSSDVVFMNEALIVVEEATSINIQGNLLNDNLVELNGTISIAGDLDNGTGGSIYDTNGLGSLTVEGTINNDGIIEDGIIEEESIPLPVKLYYFNASNVQGEVEIDWATFSESNNSHFEILRSYDMVTFETITQIEGAGNSSTVNSYSYVDSQANRTAYYKIRQVDFDGKYEESEIEKVVFFLFQTNFSVFPNPSSNGVFELQIQGVDQYETISLTVVTIQGTVIFNDTISCDSFGQLDQTIDLLETKGVLTLMIKTQTQVIKKHLVSL